MTRTALLAVTLLTAAPLPALAQEAVPAPAEPTPAAKATPTVKRVIDAKAASGVTLAIYKTWTSQADPKVMRTDMPQDEAAPKVEIRGKDAWAEQYGMKFAFTKVSYRARF